MNAMLYKYAATFLFIPKPMIFVKILITCIVLKKTVKKISEYFFIDYFFYNRIQGVVSLHKINHVQQIKGTG